MATHTFSSGINQSFSSQLNQNFAETTKVIASRLTTTSTSSTSAVTINTVTLTDQAASTAYRIVGSFTMSTVVGSAFLRLRFVGAGNTDIEFEIDDNTANGTSYVSIDVWPGSSTSVVVRSFAIRDGGAPNAVAAQGATTTLASSGTWAAQTSLELAIRVGTSGTVQANNFSIQRIGV